MLQVTSQVLEGCTESILEQHLHGRENPGMIVYLLIKSLSLMGLLDCMWPMLKPFYPFLLMKHFIPVLL